jgi:hypothetical protein
VRFKLEGTRICDRLITRGVAGHLRRRRFHSKSLLARPRLQAPFVREFYTHPTLFIPPCPQPA